MKRKILEIINKNGIRDAGFCDYSLVKERLLPCRALQRLPENAKTVILLLFPYKVRNAHPENICQICLGAGLPRYNAKISFPFPDDGNYPVAEEQEIIVVKGDGRAVCDYPCRRRL